MLLPINVAALITAMLTKCIIRTKMAGSLLLSLHLNIHETKFHADTSHLYEFFQFLAYPAICAYGLLFDRTA